MGEVLIWWLSPSDIEAICAEAIGDFCSWPEYLRIECKSLRGRSARGRLWLAPQFSDVRAQWPEPGTALSRRLEHYGGICIHASDAPLVYDLPGVVTDLGLRRWRPEEER